MLVLFTIIYIIITYINSSEHRNGVHLLLWIEKPQSKYGRFELIIVIGMVFVASRRGIRWILSNSSGDIPAESSASAACSLLHRRTRKPRSTVIFGPYPPC